MFHDIPQPILARMRQLEQIDSRDRSDGTPRMERLRQIPPEVGKFIAFLAASPQLDVGLRLERVGGIRPFGWLWHAELWAHGLRHTRFWTTRLRLLDGFSTRLESAMLSSSSTATL